MDEIKGLKEVNFEELILKYRFPLIILLAGLLVLSLGIFFLKGNLVSQDKVEVLDDSTGVHTNDFIIIEVSGEVTTPGVYKLTLNSRVEDAIIGAGGFSADADREWVEKTLNRAAKLVDGQKIFIPAKDENSNVDNQQSSVQSANTFGVYQTNTVGQGSGLTNINSASKSVLEDLNGIGPVYAQKIIEQRPYSNIEELVSKKVIPKSTYEKIKNEISVY